MNLLFAIDDTFVEQLKQPSIQFVAHIGKPIGCICFTREGTCSDREIESILSWTGNCLPSSHYRYRIYF